MQLTALNMTPTGCEICAFAVLIIFGLWTFCFFTSSDSEEYFMLCLNRVELKVFLEVKGKVAGLSTVICMFLRRV